VSPAGFPRRQQGETFDGDGEVPGVNGGEGGVDTAAQFDAFYAECATRVVRQLVLLTGDVAEAEDVSQEAFERAWLRWSTVRDLESPEAWVRTVSRRLAVSRWRRMRNASVAWRRHGPPVEQPELDPGHVALIAALAMLPRAQRVSIVLHHLADLSVAEVAEETGASVSAVKQQLVRGRAALAGLLAECPPVATRERALVHRTEEL
jgi:RNA polymerase sigma-70 factor, ECF subfamily